MACYRCQRCLIRWPTSISAAYCPECGGGKQKGRLRYEANGAPIAPEEANSRIAHARFRRFYNEEWPDKRLGPDPDSAEARAETREWARAQIARIRQLDAAYGNPSAA